MGSIEAIFTAASHGSAPSAQPSGNLEAGVGLNGDRYAGSGIVSLIEAEEIAAFNSQTGMGISAADTGRNIVTRGIALNELVGQKFRVGDAELEGTELCEPCATLGRNLATANVSAADVVQHLTHKAGIRARVLRSGTIAPGTAIGPQ